MFFLQGQCHEISDTFKTKKLHRAPYEQAKRGFEKNFVLVAPGFDYADTVPV